MTELYRQKPVIRSLKSVVLLGNVPQFRQVPPDRRKRNGRSITLVSDYAMLFRTVHKEYRAVNKQWVHLHKVHEGNTHYDKDLCDDIRRSQLWTSRKIPELFLMHCPYNAWMQSGQLPFLVYHFVIARILALESPMRVSYLLLRRHVKEADSMPRTW